MAQVPELRTTRDEIASLEYDGPESLASAEVLQRRMVAAAEVAKRARVNAREYLWTAREADRTLGRMIIAAREAGDLAPEGRRHDLTVDDLHSYGIERHLAANAVKLAQVPADIWQDWQSAEVEPTVGKVVKAAIDYLNSIADAERRRKMIEEERARIERQLRALLDQPPPQADIPPLTSDETDITGTENSLKATRPELPYGAEAAERWTKLFQQVAGWVKLLEQSPPELPDEQFVDMTVMAARDLARKLTAATATWLRTVNAAYSERIGDGPD